MRKKQTVYWCHSHFLNWLGGSTYILEVAKRLNKRYNITIVADKFSSDSENKFKSAGIKTLSLSGFSTNNYLYWLFLPCFLVLDWFRLRKIVKAGDVVITSMFPMNVVALLLSSNRHVQLCYEPYALFYDRNYINGFTLFNRLPMNVARILYSWLDIMATRDADTVLTLSSFNRKWIRKIYDRDSIIVYEGVDTNFFRRTSNKDLENKYSKYKVLFHSTDFTKIKGTGYLLRALPLIQKAVPNIKLLVTSTIQNKAEKERLLKFVTENNLGDSVKFLDFIPFDQLPTYLSLAKVVVQPSVGQSMSLTVKEAMSCATPVITSVEGGEQYADGEAGYLIDPKDSRKLADGVVKLLKNDKIAKNMGINGTEIVKKKFSWDVVCEKIEYQIGIYL